MPEVLEFKIPFVKNVSGLKVNLLTLLQEKENQLRETIYSNRTLIVILWTFAFRQESIVRKGKINLFCCSSSLYNVGWNTFPPIESTAAKFTSIQNAVRNLQKAGLFSSHCKNKRLFGLKTVLEIFKSPISPVWYYTCYVFRCSPWFLNCSMTLAQQWTYFQTSSRQQLRK